MPVSALLLALAAAAVHATWNLLLSGEEDTHSASAVALLFGTLVFAPVAVLTWRLDSAVVPYVVASSALELLYLALLATGYSVAAMSFIYPIARGSAPVLVLIAGAVFVGASVSVLAAVGVVVVALGIVLVRGLHAGGRARDLALALSVGACIAGYTLVDKRGITHAAPITYLELVFGVTAIGYVLGVLRLRGAAALRAAVRRRTLVAGIGFFAAYALTLAALRLAPAASVAAVRESSVVMATAFLSLSGREKIGPERLAGAVAVVVGIALISLA
ncbi:MAG TPA: EamA family transporter [Solirubrobacteraceae bacterium]|nr:EamA family transporter [Solirubrobacteraceae bacterium]